MERINGILGASLAGFATLTMAAITTTTITTEAIAFQAVGPKVRTAAPTRMRPASSMHRVPVNSTGIRTVTEKRVPHMSINTGPPPTPPLMQPETSVMGEVRVPTDHSLPISSLDLVPSPGPVPADPVQHHPPIAHRPLPPTAQHTPLLPPTTTS